MTIASTDTALAGQRPSLLARIVAFYVAYAATRTRSEQIIALTALSDEDLAGAG